MERRHTDLDRRMLSLFREPTAVPPLMMAFFRALECEYQREYMLLEQEKVRELYAITEVRFYDIGFYVLMSSLVRPPVSCIAAGKVHLR